MSMVLTRHLALSNSGPGVLEFQFLLSSTFKVNLAHCFVHLAIFVA
jgi:hypothetical protein